MLPLKLDFCKVRLDIALHTEQLPKRGVVQAFAKIEETVERLPDLHLAAPHL